MIDILFFAIAFGMYCGLVGSVREEKAFGFVPFTFCASYIIIMSQVLVNAYGYPASEIYSGAAMTMVGLSLFLIPLMAD